MQRKKPKEPKEKVAPSSPAPVDQEAVTMLAYELYVRRGGEHGHDAEDWLMAEQMLLEQQKRSGPTRRAVDASRRVEEKFRRR